MKKVKLFNFDVNALTMNEVISYVDITIQKSSKIVYEDINAAKLVWSKNNIDVKNSMQNADMLCGDGQSIVWASRFLGQSLPERVAGIDLMQNLVELASEKNYKVFFFGAKEEVVKGVVDKYSEMYSSEIIAGYRNGYFGKDEEESIAKQIASSGADILFVAISSPTKEIFLNKYKYIIDTPFVMGVGGSFDVVAGKVTRAPLWMQKAGLEWFYRFLQEPRRMWKRYLVTNSLFIYYMLKEKVLG